MTVPRLPTVGRVCSRCKIPKDIEQYPKAGYYRDGSLKRRGYCKPCYVIIMRGYYRRNPVTYGNMRKRAQVRASENPAKNMWMRVRSRANREGTEFSLTIEDLLPLPKTCPVLGMQLIYSGDRKVNDPALASLDRIDNTKGYIPGNVIVVSHRVNGIKRDAQISELRRIADFYSSLT